MINKNAFKTLGKKTENPIPPSETPPKFTKNLNGNLGIINNIFSGHDCLIVRRFSTPAPFSVKCAAVFIESMANDLLVTEFLIKGLITRKAPAAEDPITALFDRRMLGSDIKIESDPEKIVAAILAGNAVLFTEGSEKAAVADTRGYKNRAISEPENEKLLRGPHEGFTESFMENISLVRRRLATADLKVKFFTLGRRTNTTVAVCYLKSLTKPEILKTLCDRLSKIDIDGIIDSNYVEEHIRDKPAAPFRTVGSTERPDTAVARILEGRIGIVVSGSPVVLTVPFIFIENFQSGDDYYQHFFYANIGRLLRFLGFFLTVSIPAIYVSLLCFHQQMMPTNFALSIMSIRTNVPFPTFVEGLLLIVVFEILREASLRMPAGIAQTFGIVGAIVVGESAISANIIDAPMVIIIGFTALTELMIPRLNGVIIFYRIFLFFLSGFIGLYGYIFGCCLMLIRLLSIESFGVQYMSYAVPGERKKMQDTLIRVPIQKMTERPAEIAADKIRQKLNE